MFNPVGGPTDPNQPPLSPNLQGNTSKRVASVANEVFSSSGGASSLSDSLFSRVSAEEVRPSKEDILNEWLASQPEAARSDAERILDILREKDLDNPFELDLPNARNITSLPNVLQNCTRLNCSFCTSLQALPELPVCIELNCSNCTSLQALPELPACEWLECTDCTSLRELPPELPACTRLDCSNCTSLQALPELPVCRRLYCFNCTSLVAITALPDCIKLDCSNCTSLQALPQLPVCRELDCTDCTSLQTLSALPVCRRLYCTDCTSLQALPALPVCTILSCSYCTSLQALPALPVCSELWCGNCTSLRELPPALPACIRLNCPNCTSLQALPELRICQILNCENCPLLPLQRPAQPPNPYQSRTNPYQSRIDRAAQGTLQDALDFWSRLLPQGQEPLPSAEALKFDDDTRARDERLFQIFFNRLQETADFREANPQDFALRVASIVRDMVASKEFREKAIWALDDANAACGDRVTTGIESLEILSLIYGQKKPQTDVDTAFLAIRLDRLDQVRKKAEELNPGPEGLETVLFLQLKLKDRLQLPLQTGGMLYPRVGVVQPEVVERTAQEILAATSTDEQVYEILVNSEVWTDFLHRKPKDVYY
ncbi:MAG: hypothetical protein FJZ62_04970, partial [Chlamydiae bacterium]|nr:hypothetical protein [Chlamydiota bacterium]